MADIDRPRAFARSPTQSSSWVKACIRRRRRGLDSARNTSTASAVTSSVGRWSLTFLTFFLSSTSGSFGRIVDEISIYSIGTQEGRQEEPMTDLARFSHDHAESPSTDHHEKRTRWVVVLTCLMMVGELVVGYLTGSMALTADGWHMATHAGALGMAAFAYWFARTRAKERSFSFGTGKIHALAGYTSAVALAFVAVWMM